MKEKGSIVNELRAKNRFALVSEITHWEYQAIQLLRELAVIEKIREGDPPDPGYLGMAPIIAFELDYLAGLNPEGVLADVKHIETIPGDGAPGDNDIHIYEDVGNGQRWKVAIAGGRLAAAVQVKELLSYPEPELTEEEKRFIEMLDKAEKSARARSKKQRGSTMTYQEAYEAGFFDVSYEEMSKVVRFDNPLGFFEKLVEEEENPG